MRRTNRWSHKLIVKMAYCSRHFAINTSHIEKEVNKRNLTRNGSVFAKRYIDSKFREDRFTPLQFCDTSRQTDEAKRRIVRQYLGQPVKLTSKFHNQNMLEMS